MKNIEFKFRIRMSDIAKDAVFVATGEFPEPNPDKVEGYDFENGCEYDKLFAWVNFDLYKDDCDV